MVGALFTRAFSDGEFDGADRAERAWLGAEGALKFAAGPGEPVDRRIAGGEVLGGLDVLGAPRPPALTCGLSPDRRDDRSSLALTEETATAPPHSARVIRNVDHRNLMGSSSFGHGSCDPPSGPLWIPLVEHRLPIQKELDAIRVPAESADCSGNSRGAVSPSTEASFNA
jgi:hypothetical protein